MQSEPLISVVLASYNHEKFVKSAIDSILCQSYQNIQVIVIDDGSTDKTVDIAKKIKDKRLKVIKLKENRRFHPRNIGLRFSRGEYVAFQNSDDVWLSDKLQKQLDFLETHPNFGAVFTQVKLIDSLGKTPKASWAKNLFQTSNRNRIEWLKYFLTIGNSLCISSVLIRRSILNKVGNFNESLVQLSDLDLWIRIVGISEIHILPDKLTMMRIVKDKNYSSPSPASSNRSVMELVQVLARFSEEPILGQMGKIIPGKFRDLIPLGVIQQGRLIQKCWQLGNPAHILFATQLTNKLLENPQNRQTLSICFGTSFIRDYIYMKGKVGLSVTDLP